MRHSRISSQYIRAAQNRGRDLSRFDRCALPRRMSNATIAGPMGST